MPKLKSTKQGKYISPMGPVWIKFNTDSEGRVLKRPAFKGNYKSAAYTAAVKLALQINNATARSIKNYDASFSPVLLKQGKGGVLKAGSKVMKTVVGGHSSGIKFSLNKYKTMRHRVQPNFNFNTIAITK